MRLSPSRFLFLINIGIVFAVFVRGFSPDAFRPDSGAESLAKRNGSAVTFRGRVCEEADVSDANRRLTVCAGRSRVLVTADLYPAYGYGDSLEISGLLQAPPLIEGFDYDAYLARYGICSVMYYPDIALREGTLTIGQRVYHVLIRFKQQLRYIIERQLPEPEAGLATAILLGYRRSVSREDLDMFARSGLSHMIAISGSHLTILGAMVLNFCLFLGSRRQPALGAVLLFLVFYPFITGLSASAVRAAIMGSLGLLAASWGRASSLIRALALAAAMMLVFNPRLLRDDVGFQLSFLAVFGLAYIYPVGSVLVRKLMPRSEGMISRGVRAVVDTLVMTLAVQAAVWPILVSSFGQVSLVSPLANLAVLWSFPPLLASLVAAISATAAVPALGQIWFFPAYLLLHYIILSSRALAGWQWAAIETASVSWRWGALYYLALGVAIMFRETKKPFHLGRAGEKIISKPKP